MRVANGQLLKLFYNWQDASKVVLRDINTSASQVVNARICWMVEVLVTVQ